MTRNQIAKASSDQLRARRDAILTMGLTMGMEYVWAVQDELDVIEDQLSARAALTTMLDAVDDRDDDGYCCGRWAR